MKWLANRNISYAFIYPWMFGLISSIFHVLLFPTLSNPDPRMEKNNKQATFMFGKFEGSTQKPNKFRKKLI